MDSADSDIARVEGQGALNFLDIDDIPLVEEGEPLHPDSITPLEFDGDRPVFPPITASPDDPFLRRLQQSGKTWAIPPAGRLEREVEPGEGPSLKATAFESDTLHAVLVAFVGFAGDGKGYAAIMSLDPEGPGSVVLISNDPDLEASPASAPGLMRTYPSAAVLGSAALFAGLATQMFGYPSEAAEEAAEEQGTLVDTGLSPNAWLFADVQGDIDAAVETVVMCRGDGIDLRAILELVLRLPGYTVLEDDYLTFEDDRSGALVVAQPFPTDGGDYVELRLTLPPMLTGQDILARLHAAGTGAGLGEVLRVVDYDDTDGVVQANPVRADGSEGPMRVLRMAF